MKPRKPKPQIKKPRLTLKAKNPRKLKAALKTWVEASDQVDADPLGLDDAPLWVEAAWVEVVKVVLPGHRLPTTGEWDAELIGELQGRLQAFGRLFCGEIPMSPAVQAEHDRFQKFVGAQPQTPKRIARGKVLARDLQTRVDAVQQSIPNLMTAVLASSHEDALKFQKGLARGMNLSPDELVSANVFERHTRTFFVLALYWGFWVTCKSLREVYNHLCQAVGKQKIGGFKTFEKLCAKIGLKLRGRGRPSKKK